mmetsp:Transcript_15692/g.33389  ORF Transcript_15692/g.33389 Transcript_15692/m.33389 type:complete len:236 (-) Transcript_15692:75-782(-)
MVLAACCNPRVEAFMLSREQGAHLDRVAKTRSHTASRWSPQEVERMQAAKCNAKRMQLEEERQCELERRNLELLHRMRSIEQRGAGGTAGSRPSSARVGSAQTSAAAASSPAATPCRPTSAPPPGSRAVVRDKEQRRIEEDNLRLLRRLRNCRPSMEWKGRLEAEYKEHERAVHRLRKSAHLDGGGAGAFEKTPRFSLRATTPATPHGPAGQRPPRPPSGRVVREGSHPRTQDRP